MVEITKERLTFEKNVPVFNSKIVAFIKGIFAMAHMGYGRYAFFEGSNLKIEFRGLFKIHDDKKFLRIDMGGFFTPKSHWEDQEAEELRDKEWCENHYFEGPDNTE